ncbi:hypothetical protein B0H16DRAFT_1454158 [Mycena metata]|uniref:Uncharacterized protein n=1 Tax=Mycena metata TaxID=1033252 RepID=A0AAD7JII4_9AGAR|nr:hypothetical protein B0H16DRAFT_1454158 [Mycena metata]
MYTNSLRSFGGMGGLRKEVMGSVRTLSANNMLLRELLTPSLAEARERQQKVMGAAGEEAKKVGLDFSRDAELRIIERGEHSLISAPSATTGEMSESNLAASLIIEIEFARPATFRQEEQYSAVALGKN